MEKTPDRTLKESQSRRAEHWDQFHRRDRPFLESTRGSAIGELRDPVRPVRHSQESWLYWKIKSWVLRRKPMPMQVRALRSKEGPPCCHPRMSQSGIHGSSAKDRGG